MNTQQRSFASFIFIVMIMTLHQYAFANPLELSLEDSITMALGNNHDIKYAQSAKEKSYWAVTEAKKNKGISVDLSHISERYNTPPSVLSPSYTYTTDYDNTLSLSLPIYSGNQLENKIDQAKLSLKIAEWDIDVAKQQLKLDVVTDYFTVLEYRNEVQVDQETVDNYVDHLNLVKTKYELGLVAKTDVLASQVDLAKAQDSLIKAQNNYNNAIATLNNAIGLSHETDLKLKDGFQYEKYSKTLEECIEYAKSHRLELVQYEANIASAQYDVKIAEGGYLPTVALTAEENWNDTHLPGAKNNNWLLKLTASFNVFDSGLTNSKVQQAKHSVDMVEDKAAKEHDTILLDVRQYYLSMYEAEKRIETNKVSVDQAAESLMIQKVRYDVGVSTNLDLLDAVLSLDSAKKDHIQALYDYTTNKAKLEQAMGVAVK